MSIKMTDEEKRKLYYRNLKKQINKKVLLSFLEGVFLVPVAILSLVGMWVIGRHNMDYPPLRFFVMFVIELVAFCAIIAIPCGLILTKVERIVAKKIDERNRAIKEENEKLRNMIFDEDTPFDEDDMIKTLEKQWGIKLFKW